MGAEFDINLIAVRRITDGSSEIIGHSKFASYDVREGDWGIVSRIPDGHTGLSRRIVTDDMILTLSQATHPEKTEENLARRRSTQSTAPLATKQPQPAGTDCCAIL